MLKYNLLKNKGGKTAASVSNLQKRSSAVSVPRKIKWVKKMERIVILNFRSPYAMLIARRVREAGVYSEILPPDSSLEKIKGEGLNGVILTCGTDGTPAENAGKMSDGVLSLGVPVLGICAGMQLICNLCGAGNTASSVPEYGRITVHFKKSPLFKNIPDSAVWMNRNNDSTECPEGFIVTANADNCPACAIENSEKQLYGIQFHPEIDKTEYGAAFFGNFVHGICGCKGSDWNMKDLADELIAEIKAKVGDGKVVAGLSGGVDSSVAATLVHKAIGDKLTCVFVDHGLLRLNEADEVMDYFRREIGLNVIKIDARERFLSKLRGVTDPEQKRKIIGTEFIRVFEEQAKKIGADYLLQGTIYPDVIESGIGGAVIKSHHNVGGLPKDIAFKGLVEPLRKLFKDEVRALGESLGMPAPLVWRQPFPGPGLGIRVMGEITEEKLDILRKSDYILRDEIAKAGLDRKIWQYFTVFTGVQSVGVMADKRTYDYAIAIRAVSSVDAMTVEFAELPYPLLRRISTRIISETPHVNRVVFDITDKPPGTIEWE